MSKWKKASIYGAAGLFGFVLLLFLLAYAFSVRMLAKTTDEMYYNVKVVFMCNNILIGLKEYELHEKKNDALGSDPLYLPAIISVRSLSFLEITLLEEESGEGGSREIPRKYLGKYKINLSGHIGYLYVTQSKQGRLYGTVRFPSWAKGAYEKLKNIRIRGNKIYFTRSVTTYEEMKKVGIDKYFVQKFKGEYSLNGSVITGTFKSRGGTQMWEAYKTR